MLKRVAGLMLVMALTAAFAPARQELPGPVRLAIEAGFDGNFRENQWMPIFIRASNDGAGVEGRLVVRPETSPNAVENMFSLPISLPQGSRKTVFLYITAQGFASQIRVELMHADGTVITAETATLRGLQPRDQLHVVVSESPTSNLDLTSIHDGGYTAFQANWRIENIPDRAAALDAINTLVFSDVDSSRLSSGQTVAIRDWTARGGHLIVTGGAGWQGTAAGLADSLPLKPEDSATLESLEPLAEWVRFQGDRLDQTSVVASGTLQPNARVLVMAGGGQPLLVRRNEGAGTVDYLAADPNALPLRGWGGMTELWTALATTVGARPGWTFGFNDWETASDSASVIPGVDLLPDILPLCGFLAAYIALIGPLNYLILNKINRREYAWVTIPAFIVAFSALAYALGFNLRGNEVTLSRLSVVESWPDTPRSRLQEITGLLSPRRAQYNLALDGESMMHPAPRVNPATSALFSANLGVNTDIQQIEGFKAADFPVDASFIATFHSTAIVERPEVGGRATLAYDGENGQRTMRGSVTNNSVMTLSDAVILVSGQALHLEQPIEPGDVVPFTLTLPGEGLPSPAPLAFAPGLFSSVYFRSLSYQNSVSQTLKDMMGDQLTERQYFLPPGMSRNERESELFRRRLFLASFIDDPYRMLTGRGNQAYLAAWTDRALLTVDLEGGNWTSHDTTLYLVQLAVDLQKPAGEVTVTSDQFTWMVQARNTMSDIAPLDIALQPGDEAVFRFTPLPESILSDVRELTLRADRSVPSRVRTLGVGVWNWANGIWEAVDIRNGTVSLRNPARFLGPENAVQVRVTADALGGYPRIQDLSVEQRGVF